MLRETRARQVAVVTVLVAVGLAAGFAWLRNLPSQADERDALRQPEPSIVEQPSLATIAPAEPAALAAQPVPSSDMPSKAAATPSAAVTVPAKAAVPPRPAAALPASPPVVPADPTPRALVPSPDSVPDRPPPMPADRLAVGQAAFERLGCMRCHSIAGRGNPSNPLDGIGTRREPAAIRDGVLGVGAAKASMSAGTLRAKARARDDPDLDALVAYLGQLGK